MVRFIKQGSLIAIIMFVGGLVVGGFLFGLDGGLGLLPFGLIVVGVVGGIGGLIGGLMDKIFPSPQMKKYGGAIFGAMTIVIFVLNVLKS